MAKTTPDASDGEQRIVTFKIGPKQRHFLIHMDIVCKSSPVFSNALKSGFKEGIGGVIILEETEVEVFKIVMDWMYTGRMGPHEKVLDEEGNEVELVWDYVMSGVYVFAEMYDMVKLRDFVHTRFKKRFETGIDKAPPFPSHSTIIRVFNNVPETSPICKTFSRKFAEHWMPAQATQVELELFQELPLNFTLMSMTDLEEVRDERS
ncbi:hypothetical protein IWZ03DRAFT_362483 [Phyllosticta citriasiana]|uniref:BTB domain-containing protein n=1 Tax=Phyllosticta citriasiana TaxID=595635 RepID=A0ABR1KC93_9PEZI